MAILGACGDAGGLVAIVPVTNSCIEDAKEGISWAEGDGFVAEIFEITPVYDEFQFLHGFMQISDPQSRIIDTSDGSFREVDAIAGTIFGECNASGSMTGDHGEMPSSVSISAFISSVIGEEVKLLDWATVSDDSITYHYK